MISYFQAIVIGLLQGVTELFPDSGLGHSVLVPARLGMGQLGFGPVGERVLLARLRHCPAHRDRVRAFGVLPD